MIMKFEMHLFEEICTDKNKYRTNIYFSIVLIFDTSE